MLCSFKSIALSAGEIFMFTPSASRQSAVPHLLDAARFPCFATGIFVDDTIIDAMVCLLYTSDAADD